MQKAPAAYRKMLVNVRLQTEAAIAKGQTLEQFLASQPTADYDKAWGDGFLNPKAFLTIVYQSLAQ
ncbi:hypothetical protein IQ266_11575 [filamentous cyanobacterium LEGE 11480]|uniref:Uncharacterized protein n=1 Tax=Romeriopsis navalis LEGE 11480 TaxID=2777977 RepID=A0A928VPA0_9CYAN|nr:hypothetical protein [Romeriopsis navalis]MBE9030371.1 hypothetical protein [Romeriopsis navalis LEGE 11480]